MNRPTQTITAATTHGLVPQTGMPAVYQNRSRSISLKYDSLVKNPIFIFDPFGPRKLYLSRPRYHW
jgi:hypothetical protein